MSEKFSLKWNDFSCNTSSYFSKLRNDEDFHDVTLVSDDQKQVPAHKVVLSSCSDYFRNILKNNKHPHPLLCLHGISSSELDQMLNYVYNGEVMIHQEELDRFLQTAQRFQLKGMLQQGIDDTEDKQEFKAEIVDPENMYNIGAVNNIESYANDNEKLVDINNHHNHQQQQLQKTEFEAYPSIPQRQIKENTISKVNVTANGSMTIEEIDEKIKEYMGRNDDRTYFCKYCGKSGVAKSQNMKNHIETHLEGIQFSCQQCQNTFRLRGSLFNHISLKHNKIDI